MIADRGSDGTRAIILAAGRGARLGAAASDRPKVMIEFSGRTILAHQRAALARAGIDGIGLVLGHAAGLAAAHEDAAGMHHWFNEDFAVTNMVVSLLCAEDALDGSSDVIVAYGDIVYEPRLVRALLDAEGEVAVVVDLEWRTYWEARMDDPLADVETLRMASDGRLIELGDRPTTLDEIEGQYIGLFRVRADAARAFAELGRTLAKEDPCTYMTTLLQRFIDDGRDVRSVPVRNGWLEFDRPEDLALDVGPFWSAVETSG